MLAHACSVSQSYPTLCDLMDCSPLGSPAHGIFQTRILEWVIISSSRGTSQGWNLRLLHVDNFFTAEPPGKPCVCVCVSNSFLYAVAVQSHLTLCNSMDCSMPGSPVFAMSLSLLKFMSIEAVMLSNQLINIIL